MKHALLTLSALMWGLSSPALAAQPITAEVVGIEEVQVGLSGAHFTLRTSLTRTRGLPIVVQGVQYQLLVNDEVIGMGEQTDNLRLRRNKPAELLIPSTLAPRGGVGALAAMLGNAELEITYIGEATGRWLFFSRTVSFSDTVSTEELFSAIFQ